MQQQIHYIFKLMKYSQFYLLKPQKFFNFHQNFEEIEKKCIEGVHFIEYLAWK